MTQFQQPHVAARLLGDFALEIDGVVVSAPLQRSKKPRGVLQYLLLHADRPVPHTELYETFWPEEKSANPHAALKTLMHRLRLALVQGGAPEGLQLFVVGQGSYQWNPELHTEIDFVLFEQDCQALRASGLSRQARLALLRGAYARYGGRFLDGSELWMAAPAAYLHGLYRNVVRDLSDLLEQDGETEEVVSICRTALRIDELDEDLNLKLIRALAASGRTREAMAQYQRVTELCYNELGVQVSDELRGLYRKIAAAERAMDTDIDSVRGALEEKEESPGAYVCEFGIFQDIYRIEERCLARYGGRIFLGLLTLTDARCDMPEQSVLTRAMERLLATACANLRNCDVISRFSPAQYVLLLPTVTYETGQMVLERIRKAFRRDNPRVPVVVSCKLRPLRPADTQQETDGQ